MNDDTVKLVRIPADAWRAVVAALEDVERRVERCDAWWIDCPDKGGIDTEVTSAALELARKVKP